MSEQTIWPTAQWRAQLKAKDAEIERLNGELISARECFNEDQKEISELQEKRSETAEERDRLAEELEAEQNGCKAKDAEIERKEALLKETCDNLVKALAEIERKDKLISELARLYRRIRN